MSAILRVGKLSSVKETKDSMYRVGMKVMHALHGVGDVESMEEKTILGQVTRFAVISFQESRMKIMVNVDQGNGMIRPTIHPDQVEDVMEHLRRNNSQLPSKSTDRYAVNLTKIKSGDIIKLAEVVKDLIVLGKEKRTSPKEQTMLKQARRILAAELACVTGCEEDEMEKIVDHTCRINAPEMAMA